MTRTAPARTTDRTFDWKAWPLDGGRTAATACMFAFAAALWSQGGVLRWLGVAIAAETVLIALPWRVPRRRRGGASFWAETSVGMLVPVGAGVLAVVCGPSWFGDAPAWWWYPLSVAVGVLLVLLSGMNLRALASGDLAFLYGPTARPHALARVTASTLSPTGEEVVFRGVYLMAPAAAAWPLGLLAAVAFVARHHLAPGDNRRGSARATATEVGAAVVLLALTAASGSILPALVAHLVNNAPSIVFELQRERDEGGTS
ncbi:CPBP family glutamic-type intramembrane protease [Streptomyces sp. NPDC094049]|uniref:CPBP family glutamic-type intramembrane protease n=1 Tax=Streptomyces sp. NPDC094049 TaxID=3154987 RepID=UPI0033260095